MFNDYREEPLFEPCPECEVGVMPMGQDYCEQCHRKRLIAQGFNFDTPLDPDECPFCECTPCVCMEGE
jgi:hypothetical protein